MGGKGSAPPAPDYSALASQQAAANVQAAKQTASLSNPNIVSPWAKQNVTYSTQYSKPEPVKPGQVDTSLDAYLAANPNATATITNKNRWGQGTPTYAGYESWKSGQQSAYDQSLKDYEKAQADYEASAMTTPTVTQDFGSEEQKAAWQAQQTANQRLAELGVKGIGQVESVFDKPFQYTGPGIQTSLGDAGQIGSVDMQQYGQAGGGPAAGEYGLQQGGVEGPNYQMGVGGYGNVNQQQFNAPQLQTSLGDTGNVTRKLDTSNLAQMPVNAGTTAQQAIMSRLQPQLQQQRSALQTQLANQGITPGSEAYNRAMTEQGQKENDLMSQAALQGINLDMSARQQGFGEATTSAGFQNEAQQQAFNQALASGQYGNTAQIAQFGANLQGQQAGNAAQQQAFQQALESGRFGNEAQQAAFQARMANQQAGNQASAANFAQGQAAQQMRNAALGQNQQTALAQMQANNAAQNQRYNQMLQAAQFGNTADQQEFQRQLGLYNMPLNQVSALLSGSQVATPQFQGYQGAGVTASPIFQAGQAQYGAAMDQYNAQQAANNALTGGLFNLGAGFLGGWASGIKH